MRALFWLFPAILSVGTKGAMIRQVKYQLGAVASKMLKEAKVVCDADLDNSLMANMRMCPLVFPIGFSPELWHSQDS